MTETIASNIEGNSDTVLEVKSVSKKFCRNLKRSLYYGLRDIASEFKLFHHSKNTLRKGEFWALQDVSIKLKRGESLGLVGPNGSGKTTLLKIICGLIRQEIGIVKTWGRVAPLIALGAGFNPILTGRENIYVNMSILGLSKKRIEEKYAEVVKFAELGSAIDAPVRTYSSGMAARLGFSCAIHTEPDILLIDEVLSVGDLKFRGKCYRRLEKLRANQTSIIMVSHNPEAIFSVCNNACYLRNGDLIAVGDVDSVLSRYEKDIFFPKAIGDNIVTERGAKQDNKQSLGIDILSVYFRDKFGSMINTPKSGEAVNLCLEYFAHRPMSNVCWKFSIHGDCGEALFFNNLNDGIPLQLLQGKSEIQVEMQHLGLNPGYYSSKMSLLQGKLKTLDSISSFKFVVKPNPKIKNASRSQYYQPRTWKVKA